MTNRVIYIHFRKHLLFCQCDVIIDVHSTIMPPDDICKIIGKISPPCGHEIFTKHIFLDEQEHGTDHGYIYRKYMFLPKIFSKEKICELKFLGYKVIVD